MDIYCTRPTCPKPQNSFPDLESSKTVKTVTQKFCSTCGMPLILAGRYMTEKPLARGGFGAAFIARDRLTPAMKKCVVKQLLPTGLTPDQMEFAKELFDREGAVLEDLGRHPQIPDLLAFFEVPIAGYKSTKEEIYFYLVQEFINGLTLEQVTEQYGALPEEEVIRIMKSLLPVLKYVHDNNSIHRDIKPSNIMLRTADDQYFLLDFGAVKQITVAATSQKSTGIFTPGYGAPEQMRGDRVFPSTDLYAFAATCVVLLTAKQPEDLFDVSSNRWEWRSHTQVSDFLGNILNRMLENAPSDRFATAQEVLDAINASSSPTIIPTATSAAATVITTPTSAAATVITSAPETSPIPQPAPAVKPLPKQLALPPLRNQLVAAFLVGFEGAVIGNMVFEKFGLVPALISLAVITLVIVVLRKLQIIDNKDLFGLIILTSMVAGALYFFKLVTLSLVILAISAIAGISTVAITTLIRLIYTTLYNLF